MSSERSRPDVTSLDAETFDPDRDPVASLHDTEAFGDDEDGLRDVMTVDRRALHEIGADLDPTGDEPELD
jgi:hypothetical protein